MPVSTLVTRLILSPPLVVTVRREWRERRLPEWSSSDPCCQVIRLLYSCQY